MKFFGRRSATKIVTPPGVHGDGASHDVMPPTAEMAEMSFLDHLEELRWSLIRGLGGVIAVTIVAAFFGQWIIDVVLLGPKDPGFFMYDLLGIDAVEFKLQNRTVTGQFFAHIGTIFAAGLVMGSPVFVYYMWRFIEPGLYPTEKDGLRFAAFFATFFFMVGISFGYFIITPLALQFFASYQISTEIANEFDITRYFSLVTMWAFGAGILFELPVVIYFLSKIGILTAEMMRKWRKYGLIVVLTMGAIFTPPDPFSQLLLAVPLMGLYELSILISGHVARKRERELQKALD